MSKLEQYIHLRQQLSSLEQAIKEIEPQAIDEALELHQLSNDKQSHKVIDNDQVQLQLKFRNCINKTAHYQELEQMVKEIQGDRRKTNSKEIALLKEEIATLENNQLSLELLQELEELKQELIELKPTFALRFK